MNKKSISNKLFLILLILFSNFQSLTKADDITNFEIDGMTVGNSLLDFYSLQEIKDEVLDATYYPKSKKFMIVGFESKKGDLYERHEFHIKENDKKYIIYSIKGLIELPLNNCLEQKKDVVSQIQNQINNAKRNDYKSNYGNSYGKSVAHVSDFDFKNGSTIRIWCSAWDQNNEFVKNSLYADSLTVNLSSKEQVDFVDNEAY